MLAVSSLAAGEHRVTAVYGGDEVFAGSASDDPFLVTVVAKPTPAPPIPIPVVPAGAGLAATGADPSGPLALGGGAFLPGLVLVLMRSRRRTR